MSNNEKIENSGNKMDSQIEEVPQKAKSTEPVDDKFVWMMVAVPIVFMITDMIALAFLGKSLPTVDFLAYVILAGLDERKLKATGHSTLHRAWILLPPLYLWKRTNLLHQNKHYFWGWVVSIVIALLILVGSELSQQESLLEETACKTVTEILYDPRTLSETKCKVVTIGDEVSPGFYQATAILDNGRTIRIAIEEKEGDRILVTIPPQ